ncbi:DUF397 domain-containing protein [Saccharomonospora halophila]|uniref:DUF397 domain-containing protein n=1 Tax=Saccharomonospora halophila TaxID=129922 RepID=UPI00038187A1|nr:DUF397 domain-containing protein [Saccharomonospora halophila]
MTAPHQTTGWQKSSYSGEHTNCVEFRRVDGGVQVRNSKRPDEATLHYTDDEWTAFLAGVKDGEFDL